ncbi:flagellar biosynthesis protein [Dyella jiangningensis]|jgi:flagellar biosynthesis protein|uniref:EscU/YscU/HrcU family type III secretion system export apparatus switch protein n=1 Tax=Dyella jiangningensis TaxID=1379159 RepID=UPI00045659B7|nr:flagellar biosynthesis protein [Dyella jiangningensis]AHX14345.1 flagellar biosynthesis protein [Dyella jiangningensis]MDG2538242.1 flagellar biosynthesis protein [Dyella jiangningensis]
MTTPLPPARRRVSLRLSGGPTEAAPAANLPPESLETLLARARALGIPLHHDPQMAGLLASLRLRQDVPATLYAAAAAVLSCIYDAADEHH